MNLAMNIRNKRISRGLSQFTLAEETGLSRSTIINYETGRREPRAGDIAKLAAALNVTPNELLGVEEEKEAQYRELASSSSLTR